MSASKPSGWRLLVVLGLAIASFGASTRVAEGVAGRIHAETQTISDDALPSIVHLSSLRTELFREELLLERDAASVHPHAPALRQEIAATRARELAEEAAYLALPQGVEEQALSRVLHADLTEAHEDFDAALSASSREAEHDELTNRGEAAFARAESGVRGLIELNAGQADRSAKAIAAVHQRARQIAYLLDALSAMFTLALAFMAWRAVRYFMDTQDKQQAELAARAAELEEFAGRVAHDLINPLSAAQTTLSLVERGVAAEVAVPRARASLQRANRIIDALLAFARSGARPEPGARCEAKGVVQDVLADLLPGAEERQVELRVELPATHVACAPGVLASIAGNLIGNAVKYVASCPPPRRVTVRARELRETVRFEVEDNGPGIAQEQQQLIFQPYLRGKSWGQPGIGLGLATARRLCEAHGGTIGVRSSEGEGATFWFELPRARAFEVASHEPHDLGGPQVNPTH